MITSFYCIFNATSASIQFHPLHKHCFFHKLSQLQSSFLSFLYKLFLQSFIFTLCRRFLSGNHNSVDIINVRETDRMVQCACSNGYAICKDLGSSPTYDQCSFSPVTRFLHSTIEPHLRHVPQLTSSMLSGVHVKQATRKRKKHFQLS